MDDPLLSVVQAAKRAGVCKNIVYEAIKTGDITYFQPMHKKVVRIRQSEVDKWIDKWTHKAS